MYSNVPYKTEPGRSGQSAAGSLFIEERDLIDFGTDPEIFVIEERASFFYRGTDRAHPGQRTGAKADSLRNP